MSQFGDWRRTFGDWRLSFDEGKFFLNLSLEQAVKISYLIDFYIDFLIFLVVEKRIAYHIYDESDKEKIRDWLKFRDCILGDDIVITINSDDGKSVGVTSNELLIKSAIHRISLVGDNIKSHASKLELTYFEAEEQVVDKLKLLVSLKTSFLWYFRTVLSSYEGDFDFFDFSSVLSFSPNFSIEDDILIGDFFTDVANVCLLPEFDDSFNKFISLYPYHNLDEKNKLNKNCKSSMGVFSYFNDILLVGVLEKVVAGKLNLSIKQREYLIHSILSCRIILNLEGFDKNKSEQIFEGLLKLSAMTKRPRKWRDYIFYKLLSVGCDEFKILCSNYGYYYTDPCSKRVKEYNQMLNVFEEWWNGRDIGEDDKKRISVLVDCVDDAVFVAHECDNDFVYFDFKFLEANGVFKINTKLYKRYVDIFSYVTDKRFIVVFILELIKAKMFDFIPYDKGKKLNDSLNFELSDNPIRRILCKDE